jgi:phenylacetate-coenzyme A ligase PaaK-like adenylate-forming protein
MKAYDIYGLTEIIGPGATLSTKNPTWPDTGLNPGPPRWEAND